MNKSKFSKVLEAWVEHWVSSKLKDDELLEVFSPERVLSKIHNKYILSMPGHNGWEFKPDIIAVVRSKKDQKVDLIFINRTDKGISLKEIGELYCYSKLANPLYAFMASTKAVSNEVNVLLSNNEIQRRILTYGNNKKITLFGWNTENSNINPETVSPIENRSFF